MKRGEQGSIAIAVLSIIGIVGVLATLTLIMRQPAGLVTQGEGVYAVKYGVNGVECENRLQEVYFLGYNGNYEVYCCAEDMNGQNECIQPYQVLIINKY